MISNSGDCVNAEGMEVRRRVTRNIFNVESVFTHDVVRQRDVVLGGRT